MMSDRTAIKLFLNLIFLLLHYVEVKEKYFFNNIHYENSFREEPCKIIKRFDILY